MLREWCGAAIPHETHQRDCAWLRHSLSQGFFTLSHLLNQCDLFHPLGWCRWGCQLIPQANAPSSWGHDPFSPSIHSPPPFGGENEQIRAYTRTVVLQCFILSSAHHCTVEGVGGSLHIPSALDAQARTTLFVPYCQDPEQR